MLDFANTIAPACLDALDLKRILRRRVALEREIAGRRLQSDRLEVVLHDHRDAVERSDELLRRRESLVERIGRRERVGVHDRDRVDRRTLLVVRVDARQVRLDERVAGEPCPPRIAA